MGQLATSRAGKFKLWHLLAVLAVIALITFAMIPVFLRVPQQCVLCRAERNDIHLFGFSFSTGFRDNGEFTQWFASHRPAHNHIWHCSAHGCLTDRNFLGLPLAFYMMKGHPVLHLRPEEELQFVKHSDETTLSRFFSDAASADLGAQLRAADSVRKKISEIK